MDAPDDSCSKNTGKLSKRKQNHAILIYSNQFFVFLISCILFNVKFKVSKLNDMDRVIFKIRHDDHLTVIPQVAFKRIGS